MENIQNNEGLIAIQSSPTPFNNENNAFELESLGNVSEENHVADIPKHVIEHNNTAETTLNNVSCSDEIESETINELPSTIENIESYTVINVVEHDANNTQLPMQHLHNIMEHIYVTSVTGKSHVITVTQQPVTSCGSDGPSGITASGDNTTTTACRCNCHTSISSGLTNIGYQNEIIENASIESIDIQRQNSIQSDVSTSTNNDFKHYVREISTVSLSSNTSATKPPTYNSLEDQFLNDEPPKYQDVTGNKLATELEIPSTQTNTPSGNQQQTGMNFRSKLAAFFILFGVILVTCLLVYLSITSDKQKSIE